tara:strand:+ start:6147 stop:6743 length:597 start_codon:yes stop_codon:yes gene_type:complete
MSFIDLFPSVLYVEDLNKKFSTKIEDWKKYIQNTELDDEKINGFTTKNPRILDINLLLPLKNIIIETSKKYLLELGHGFEDLQISNSWGNISPKGTNMHVHWHSNSYISGVFHLTEGSDIAFHNPLSDLWSFKTSKPLSKQHYRKWDMYLRSPKQSQLIIFPSFLKHEVSPSYNTRISIAFNIIPKGEFGMNTSKLYL